ncbi:hypothetical protein DL764_010921 [Monosporascus ibericus]|uniref:Ribosomal protein s17 n=1 Tax=Monosporascus ibericus TaxID=155417 RepID=A0A4Q4SUB1_9PEZI|nr:hypothetical protein DL764_010921 [Monosporascus ibericus]
MVSKSFIVGLLGVAAVSEAASVPRPFDHILNRRAAKAVKSRQFGGGFGGGGFGNGGGFNGGGFNNGGNFGGNNGGNNNNNGGDDNNNNNGGDNNNGGNNGGNLCIDPSVLATGSAQDGQADADAGQSASLTDDANFISFCQGKTITNGIQERGGSCNPIPMGDMPGTDRMITGIVLNPQHNDDLAENTDFDVQVQINNLQAGTFTNPDNTYYAAPQQLNNQGQVIGHTHITVQDLGNSLNPTQPPDPTQFVFFKGINDQGNGQGLLSTTVTGGLPPGNYRVCTMTAAANHQPVLMPVAQRGAQDDCQKFTVGAFGGGNNNNDNGDNNNNNQGGNGGNGGFNGGNGGFNGGFGGGNGGFGGGFGNGGFGGQQGDDANDSNAQALGGERPEITSSDDPRRPFTVEGNTFTSEDAAKQRACDIQRNRCNDAANSGAGHTLSDCDAQMQTCLSS